MALCPVKGREVARARFLRAHDCWISCYKARAARCTPGSSLMQERYPRDDLRIRVYFVGQAGTRPWPAVCRSCGMPASATCDRDEMARLKEITNSTKYATLPDIGPAYRFIQGLARMACHQTLQNLIKYMQ